MNASKVDVSLYLAKVLNLSNIKRLAKKVGAS